MGLVNGIFVKNFSAPPWVPYDMEKGGGGGTFIAKESIFAEENIFAVENIFDADRTRGTQCSKLRSPPPDLGG